MKPLSLSNITAASTGLPQSPAQKKFKTLINKIEKQRQQLQDWRKGLDDYRTWYAEKQVPLLAQWRAATLELLRFLDARPLPKSLGKHQRQMLDEIICDIADSLMGDADDLELKQIHDRHSPESYDQLQQEDQEDTIALIEEMFGFDLDGVDGRHDPEVVAELLRQRLHEQEQVFEQARATAKPRKKTARQARIESEEQQASQSLREVFRQLASALHPDRESDPDERERKTALMQRANQAYKANDLLALLSLQLEVEQIDQTAIAGLAEDKLKHYNRVLTRQSKELQDELAVCGQQLAMEFDLPLYAQFKPSQLPLVMRRESEQLRWDIAQLRRQRRELEDDKAFRAWVRAEQHAMREQQALYGREFFVY
jgi:hypothetical protein